MESIIDMHILNQSSVLFARYLLDKNFFSLIFGLRKNIFIPLVLNESVFFEEASDSIHVFAKLYCISK